MIFHRYYRCNESGCTKRWMITYGQVSDESQIPRIMAEIASVETEVAVHRTDHILDRMYIKEMVNGQSNG